jgi:hypothetical protein
VTIHAEWDAPGWTRRDGQASASSRPACIPKLPSRPFFGQLLGRPAAPRFLHHPLIRKPSGEKLSKASGDTGIRELRREGVSPEVILGRAAALGGLIDVEGAISPTELGDLVRAVTPALADADG